MPDVKPQTTTGWRYEDFAQRWVKGSRKIYGPLPGGCYGIAENDTWLPGSYDSFDTAVLAFGVDEDVLWEKQGEANDRAGGRGGMLTVKDMQS